MKGKVIAYEELVPGYEFPYASYELSAPLVSKYLKAVTSSADGFVPPLAITAHAMAAMTGALSLHTGSIHASQELEFFKLVPIGATIECRAQVAQKCARGQRR